MSMAGINPNIWSAETLIRGVGLLASQPEHQLCLSPEEPCLRNEVLASRLNSILLGWVFLLHAFCWNTLLSILGFG